MNFLLALSVIIALPVFIMLCILIVIFYKELYPKTINPSSFNVEHNPLKNSEQLKAFSTRNVKF